MNGHCCYIFDQKKILGMKDPTQEKIDVISCKERAEWRIVANGVVEDDYTEGCSEHVGLLLGDAKSYTLVKI